MDSYICTSDPMLESVGGKIPYSLRRPTLGFVNEALRLWGFVTLFGGDFMDSNDMEPDGLGEEDDVIEENGDDANEVPVEREVLDKKDLLDSAVNISLFTTESDASSNMV